MYEAVKESLRAVVRCSDIFPPLKSAAQAILEIVERHDVSFSFLRRGSIDGDPRPTGSKGDTKGA